jgi:uncharacterized protein (TIGR02246 family)
MTRGSAEDSIREVIANQEAAWRVGDAIAFSRRVAADAVFTNIFGQQFAGHGPFEQQHAFTFGSIYAGSTLKQTIAHLRFLSDDLAVFDTDAEVSGAPVLPPGYSSNDRVLRTKLLQVLVRQDG